MAWSEAARRAALEARRRKRKFVPGSDAQTTFNREGPLKQFNNRLVSDSGYRAGLAQALKTSRATGGREGYEGTYNLAHQARVSTLYRNATRAARKVKGQWPPKPDQSPKARLKRLRLRRG